MAQTIPQMFMEKVRAQPGASVQLSKDKDGVFRAQSYGTLLDRISEFAAGLVSIGVRRGDKIGLISDNRKEWLVADLAILGLGGADVPRGTDATVQEISYILSWSECETAILENDRQLAKILEARDRMPQLRRVILFDEPDAAIASQTANAGLELLVFQALADKGAALLAKDPDIYAREVAQGKRDELATLIYTSGTTGDPKGVMLSHGNFLHQTEYIPDVYDIRPGQVFLSVLPVWHSFERIIQYVVLASGATLAYSKPIGSVLLADMKAIQPHWLPSVPRIWESVKDGVYRQIKQSGGAKKVLFDFFISVGESYAFFRNHLLGRIPAFSPRSRILEIAASILPFLLLAPIRGLGNLLVFRKIKEKFGPNFIAGVSGGGALPGAVDRFFDAIGILILEGYGLTETAPVLGVRMRYKPVAGTVGPIHRGTDIRIAGEHGEFLGPGKKGVIQVRGPQVMAGYYKRPDLTAKVMTPDGWLDTGDLGMLTVHGEIRITGRAKDTIVLLGGENIEPVPIEQKLCESDYIGTAIVLGPDKKYLTALIVPKQENLTSWANENSIPNIDYESLLRQPEVRELIDYEIAGLVNLKNGFKMFERIFRFDLLSEPFQVGKELSAKQELKRHAVNEIYRKRIAKLFEEV
ncbi:MAG: AMP-binding protein [Rectinemataceae bacterium]